VNDEYDVVDAVRTCFQDERPERTSHRALRSSKDCGTHVGLRLGARVSIDVQASRRARSRRPARIVSEGAFVWHQHEHEDELFLVIKGGFTMEFRDRLIEIAEGEFIVVPRGVEHRPVADDEVHVLLFEPASTLNTGNVTTDRTVSQPQRI